MNHDGGGRGGSVSLPMYPLPELRTATERYWARVRSHAPRLGDLEPWLADVHQWWHRRDLVVSQACGWPLVTELDGLVRVIGAFEYTTPTWSGSHYRSEIWARRGDDITDPSVTAAVNTPDSLSGWISLLAATDTVAADWSGRVVWSGAHLESLRLLAEGGADLASIDAVTAAHARRRQPSLFDTLELVARGPLVPSLPLITAADTDDDVVATIRHALAAAIDPATTEALWISGFDPIDLDAYEPLRGFARLLA